MWFSFLGARKLKTEHGSILLTSDFDKFYCKGILSTKQWFSKMPKKSSPSILLFCLVLTKGRVTQLFRSHKIVEISKIRGVKSQLKICLNFKLYWLIASPVSEHLLEQIGFASGIRIRTDDLIWKTQKVADLYGSGSGDLKSNRPYASRSGTLEKRI
jgi:hypothetical protein